MGINSQEASALIVVTQHYDTLHAIGADTHSNLILLPNSPQAATDMLNNMVASFAASNQIGEAMKTTKPKLKINFQEVEMMFLLYKAKIFFVIISRNHQFKIGGFFISKIY